MSAQPTVEAGEEASLADSILDAVLAGAQSATSVADDIIAAYRNGEKRSAVCAILNVIAKSCGVSEVELDGNVLVEGIEVAPLLEELYARVPEDSAAYLLVSKDPKHRHFRRAFPVLCTALIQTSFRCEMLLDAEFLPVLCQWLIAMSETKSRSFRHTATIALLSIMEALSGVAAELQGQLTLLRAKKDIAAVQKKRDDVVMWRDHIFSQAIHQRLRDIAPDIRLAAFQSLKRCILVFPEEFMTNKYLRYLGMPLHDKRPELRAEALHTVLQALACGPDAYSRMYLFMQYFSSRFVEMSGDVDVRCTELAIRVIAMMVRGDGEVAEGSELLSNEMIDRALLTLFDERPTIREAAGILLKVFIHCRTVGEETEAEQISVATELLCSFAATLRSQYKEAMPERYLIDALWTPEKPPILLTAYQPILEAAKSSKPLEAVVGLNLLAALLLRVKDELTLGPIPKDDRRRAQKRPSAKVKEETESMRRQLSEDLTAMLCSTLELHRHSEDVLRAVCEVVAALDMSTLVSPQSATALSGLLVEMRKTTQLSSCTEVDTRSVLTRAWHNVAFSNHPLKNEAQAHLQVLLKEVMTPFTELVTQQSTRAIGSGAVKSPEEYQHIWARLHLLSSLLPTTPHWPLLKTAMAHMLTTRQNPSNVSIAVGATVNCLLWQLQDLTDNGNAGPSLDDFGQQVREVVTIVLQYLNSDETSMAVMEVLVSVTDLLALPHCVLSQTEQELLLQLFRRLYEASSVVLRNAQQSLQEVVTEQLSLAASAVPVLITEARRAVSRAEANQLRMVSGVARLALLKRLDSSLIAGLLSLWTQTPSKVVSDAFKSLFHAVRDRSGGDSFQLERDVLLAAYHHCAVTGATPSAVDTLYQTGMKLASLHFIGTDRFYANCPRMVAFGAEYAASVDPLFLQAVTPYATKLRQEDALHVLRVDLAAKEIFTEAMSPYVRSFIAGLRRAAKLEVVGGMASGSAKRGREIAGPTEMQEDGLLAEIADSLPDSDGAARRGGSNGENMISTTSTTRRASSSGGQRLSMASRVVTADGWRVPAGSDALLLPSLAGDKAKEEEEEIEVPPSQNTSSERVRSHRAVVSVPTTQETTLFSMADSLDAGEVFIATDEFD